MLTLALCSYHAERGSLQIVLESGCASVPVTGTSAILQARLLHGYSMFIGWSTVVALGVLLRARALSRVRTHQDSLMCCCMGLGASRHLHRTLLPPQDLVGESSRHAAVAGHGGHAVRRVGGGVK